MKSEPNKVWQRNRALELHGAFTRVAARLSLDGMRLMPVLARLSRDINGLTILAGWRSGRKGEVCKQYKQLRCSEKTLYKEWRRWNEGGKTPESLILKYKYVAPRDGSRRIVPAALVAELQRRCTLKTGGRNSEGLTTITAVYNWLKVDFEARRAIPGLNYDEIPDGADFPYCLRTIRRHAPGKAERALGNRGVAAFKQRAAFVTMDYSKLRKCELFTLDDVRLDLLCIDESSGKAVEVKCYILMEVASRSIVAFFLKPSGAILQEDVDELVAHGLQTSGYGIGVGYTTHILFERGAVACSEAAQDVLEGVTEGRIKVIRTSMNGGVTWIGAERDRSSGNSAGKGVIESFMRRLHTELVPLPGQIGNSYDNAPASVGYGEKQPKNPPKDWDGRPGSLVFEAERLAKFAAEFHRSGKGRLKLQLSMLYLMEVKEAVKAAIDKLNHEPGHAYQDHGTFAQAEVAPGVWKERA